MLANAAIETLEEVKEMIGNKTSMVFITAEGVHRDRCSTRHRPSGPRDGHPTVSSPSSNLKAVAAVRRPMKTGENARSR